MRLVAGATSGEEAVVLTKDDVTNLRKLVDIQVFVLRDQLECGFSSGPKRLEEHRLAHRVRVARLTSHSLVRDPTYECVSAKSHFAFS